MHDTVEAATFRWDASPRPCSVAQIWRPADTTHQSNGAYVTYDSSQAAILKCLHSECPKLNRGSRLFLGYLPCLPAGHAEADETPCAPSLQMRKRGSSAGQLTQSREKRPQPCSLISPIVKAPNSTIQLPENPALPASIAAARADGSGRSLSSVFLLKRVIAAFLWNIIPSLKNRAFSGYIRKIKRWIENLLLHGM